MSRKNKFSGRVNSKIRGIIIALVIAAVSCFVITPIVTKPAVEKPVIETLDKSRNEVLGLTAASAGVSTAITLIPGDVGTPIAEKMADLSGYFIVILGAIYIEKYLFGLMGVAAFRFIIPIACILIAVYFGLRHDESVHGSGKPGNGDLGYTDYGNAQAGDDRTVSEGDLYVKPDIPYVSAGAAACRSIAVKLITFSLALYLAVPVSTGICGVIDRSYDQSVSDTVTAAQEKADEVQSSASEATDDNGNIVENIFNKITGGIKAVVDKFEELLGSFIDAIAVLLITSCVIPIAVLIFIIWLIKMVTGVTIPAADFRHVGRKAYRKIARKGKTSGKVN